MTTAPSIVEELGLIFHTWENLGEPEYAKDSSWQKQLILCKLTEKSVTLTTQPSGVVICSNWKKCHQYMQRGYQPCPVVVHEAVTQRLREENPHVRGFKFTPRAKFSSNDALVEGETP